MCPLTSIKSTEHCHGLASTGHSSPVQTTGNGELTATVNEAEQEPAARRVWFAKGQQSTAASKAMPPRPAADMNGAHSGRKLAGDEPGSDGGTEPAPAADGSRTGARARWGKAVKSVVATDTVQVNVHSGLRHVLMALTAAADGSPRTTCRLQIAMQSPATSCCSCWCLGWPASD